MLLTQFNLAGIENYYGFGNQVFFKVGQGKSWLPAISLWTRGLPSSESSVFSRKFKYQPAASFF